MKEPLERLVEPPTQPLVVKKLIEEARVEQMQHGVFGAADVLIDVHPMRRVGRRPTARRSSCGSR